MRPNGSMNNDMKVEGKRIAALDRPDAKESV